jgi:hypothetical protein
VEALFQAAQRGMQRNNIDDNIKSESSHVGDCNSKLVSGMNGRIPDNYHPRRPRSAKLLLKNCYNDRAKEGFVYWYRERPKSTLCKYNHWIYGKITRLGPVHILKCTKGLPSPQSDTGTIVLMSSLSDWQSDPPLKCSRRDTDAKTTSRPILLKRKQIIKSKRVFKTHSKISFFHVLSPLSILRCQKWQIWRLYQMVVNKFFVWKTQTTN